jgi:L-ascorbate metabolism protein UlaG (beta-lactamase superfamily)
MKLTKYEHACFTVEKDEQVLVVDPGSLSTDFIAPENVTAVVVTHEHFDHLDNEQLAAIMDKNPDAVIVGHPDVVSKVEAFTTKSVVAGDTVEIGPFTLEFHGGKHAVIHSDIPVIANLGVMINELLYYPGDSFTLPGSAIDTLALPVSAPWMKASEAMDFLAAVMPRFAFPTHDAILSDAGKSITDNLLGGFAEKNGIEYRRLTESIEV